MRSAQQRDRYDDLGFEPIVLVPSQLRRHARTGERRLMIAVLEAAIYDYRRYKNAREAHGRTLFANVRTWFFVDDPSWPFSFRSICDEYDLNVDWMRRRLAHVPCSPAAA